MRKLEKIWTGILMLLMCINVSALAMLVITGKDFFGIACIYCIVVTLIFCIITAVFMWLNEFNE